MNVEEQKSQSTRRGPLRWEQGYRLLSIVKENPSISAPDLQLEGASIGIEISVRTAARFLQRYQLSGGNLFSSSKSHLLMVTEILQQADEALSPQEIKERALEHGVSLHLSTVYRILQRLVSSGSVIQKVSSGRVVYTWTNNAIAPQGRIVCMTCGRIVHFERDYLQGLAKDICAAFDYEHRSVELTLHALCSTCK